MLTKKLNLNLLNQNQVTEFVLNPNFYLIDQLTFLSVLSMSVNSDPINPSDGDSYIIPLINSSGIFANQANCIAIYAPNTFYGWYFVKPSLGMLSYVKDIQAFVYFNGIIWQNCGLDLVKNINTQVYALNNNVSVNTNSINTLNTNVSANTSSINILNARVDTLNNNVDLFTLTMIGDFKNSIQSANHNKWYLCNGQTLSRKIYSALFKLISTNFGVGDGSTTFTLPDFRGRVFGAIGQGDGLTNRTLGNVIGEESHILTIVEMPSHGHTVATWFGGGTANGISQSYSNSNGVTRNTNNTGGGQSHNNMQPTLFAGNVFIYGGV